MADEKNHGKNGYNQFINENKSNLEGDFIKKSDIIDL